MYHVILPIVQENEQRGITNTTNTLQLGSDKREDREGGREGGRQGGREGWRDGGMDGWMEGGWEGTENSAQSTVSMVGAMNVPNPGGPDAIAQNVRPQCNCPECQPSQPREKKLLFNVKDITVEPPEPAAAKPDAAVPKTETSAPKPPAQSAAGADLGGGPLAGGGQPKSQAGSHVKADAAADGAAMPSAENGDLRAGAHSPSFSSLKAKADKAAEEQAEAAALAFLFGHERYEYYASDRKKPDAPSDGMCRLEYKRQQEEAGKKADTAMAESLFWAKFNFSPLDASSRAAETAACTADPGPAGAPEEAPAPAESMSRAPPPAAARAVARFLSDSFQCPLTMEVMRDPVITTDGQTYERMEIERWFALGNRTSPLTGAELPSTLLFPNIALRNAIQDAAGA
jgi:hypothetical protein